MLVAKRPPPCISHDALTQLQAITHGTVITPEHPDYDLTRMNWNLAYDQHPAIIIDLADHDDFVEAVRFANHQNLNIALK